MNSSSSWVRHFQINATHKRVNWNIAPELTDTERQTIVRSLQAWQLGETSEGAHLIAAARKYAAKNNDFIYLIAVELFIREEQKHGNNLGKYLDLIGEKRLQKDWGDTLFRKIRYFNTSMEIWTLAVITAESAAQSYYQSLKDATNCSLLKQICDDILIDEAYHIDFQTERMQTIFQTTLPLFRPIRRLIYKTFFYGTVSLVWFGHRKVLSKGTPDFWTFIDAMSWKYRENFGRIYQREETRSQTQFL